MKGLETKWIPEQAVQPNPRNENCDDELRRFSVLSLTRVSFTYRLNTVSEPVIVCQKT